MVYELMNCLPTKSGTIFLEYEFVLWNYEYRTGYTIKLTLTKTNMSEWRSQIDEYTEHLIGRKYDISRWDYIFRNIKQKKMQNWVIF